MDKIDMKELGRCLRDIREASNMSADELAEKAGIQSAPTITRFETGKAQYPTFDTIYKLLNYIGGIEIIKYHDFDFSKYSPSIAMLVNYFNKGDKQKEYRNSKNEVIDYLDKNIESIRTSELKYIKDYFENKIAFQNIEDVLSGIYAELNNKNKDIQDIPYFKLINMKSGLAEELENSINKDIAEMIMEKTPDSISKFNITLLRLLHIHIMACYADIGIDNL